MSSYGALAWYYDELTRDVPYELFADYYERLFAEDGGEFKLLLDLCCGTGSLTCLMARRGYEMIGADASPEMLMEAMAKSAETDCRVRPLFINQAAEELDLYGTVDAAVSSLDSLNYVPPRELGEAFRRLKLFIRPGGLLVFDIRTPDFLRSMDGSVSVDETEDVFCVWRGRYDERERALHYGMDIFSREGEGWARSLEEHVEYAHEPDELLAALAREGFEGVETRSDGPMGGQGRVYIWGKRGRD